MSKSDGLAHLAEVMKTDLRAKDMWQVKHLNGFTFVSVMGISDDPV